MRDIAILLLCASTVWAAEVIPGDARNGAELFTSLRCVNCHSVNGQGARMAPDLGRKAGRDFTPAKLAGLMWNHSPSMWNSMENAGIVKPNISSAQVADLFAYFFAARYFDKPGDAARGRQAFAAKGCADCHGISSAGTAGAPPVTEWDSLSSPIDLSRQMWNHAPRMNEKFSKDNRKWPQLTAQNLTDILVYIQNLPNAKRLPPSFSPASAETGKQLFEVKGCADCHTGSNSLARHTAARGMNDFAAAMWNHAQSMLQKPPALNREEMERIVGYVWSLQFFDEPASAARGKKVYTAKCAACHQTAPPAATQGAFGLISGLSEHGPKMLAEMKGKQVSWPRFDGTEMADLLAYFRK
jgi:cytochrome c2